MLLTIGSLILPDIPEIRPPTKVKALSFLILFSSAWVWVMDGKPVRPNSAKFPDPLLFPIPYSLSPIPYSLSQ
jgi:hypothetical protein